jgi:pilus assembly protein CpaE
MVELSSPPQVIDTTPSPADGEGKVITVLSPKGGAGKTTLAVNTAAGLARFAPKDVVVVDTDLQFGDVGTALGLRPKSTFYDAVSVGLDDPVALKLQLAPHVSGCWALCAPDHPAQADAITPEHVAQVVRTLRKTFKYVVVDNEPGLGERALAALDESTDILMICVTDVPSARGLRKAMIALDQVKITGPTRHFVLNRADARVEFEEADIVKTVGCEISVRIPSDRAFPLAMNRGVPVVLNEEGGAAADAIWHLVETVGGEGIQVPTQPKKPGLFKRRG